MKKELSKIAFDVTQNGATEPPFSGEYQKPPEKPGDYFCVCCHSHLYQSEHQFNSGSGWPSFFDCVSSDNIKKTVDRSFNMIRTEISCSKCGAHLGHLFEDGPPPTGLRHCVNSVSLLFIDRE